MKQAILYTVAAAVLLASCASTPKRIEALDQAHADVAALTGDPMAQQSASQDLAEARKSLDAADDAAKKGKRDQVLHYAYLASQQARTGQARISEARAKQEVAQSEAERNRVLLEARTREAEARARDAQAAQASAEAAQANARQQAQEAQSQAQQAAAARQQADAAERQLALLQAKHTERGMVLTLGDVLFDTAAATLKPGADATIGRVAAFMKENEGTKIIVEGHTDSRGSDEYNQLLSQRRAQSVADALAFRGVDRGRVQAVGRGKTLPVASNDTAAGQQQNRRVEMVFSDASGNFAGGGEAVLR